MKALLHRLFRKCGFDIIKVRAEAVKTTADLPPLIPEKSLGDILPGIEENSVTLPCSQIKREKGTLPLTELSIIASIAQHLNPKKVFEFGTFTGASTLILGRNIPEESEIYTLDLPPKDGFAECPGGQGDISFLSYEVGKFYKGTDIEPKVHQLYGDSTKFDLTQYESTMDLVFVDGNHDYEIAKKDTENAFMMLKSGGVIVWDDYHPVFGPGVIRALSEFKDKEIYRIAGTRFGCYIKK